MDPIKKILVMGTTGMLGSMVFNILSENKNFEVYGTTREDTKEEKLFSFDASNDIKSQLSNITEQVEIEYIINCIGIIKPFCKDTDPEGVYSAIKINAKFPHDLVQVTKNKNIKIIQIATDCVYSGNKGNYKEEDIHDPEDVYGKTKSLGEVKSSQTLNLRCSIIGPEKKGKTSLLEWFLNQPENAVIQGYTNHLWNGITTLRFAKLCEEIIESESFDSLLEASPVHHVVPVNSVSKYELLVFFKELFNKEITIKPHATAVRIDRRLQTNKNNLNKIMKPKTIQEDVTELYKYMMNHSWVNI